MIFTLVDPGWSVTGNWRTVFTWGAEGPVPYDHQHGTPTADSRPTPSTSPAPGPAAWQQGAQAVRRGGCSQWGRQAPLQKYEAANSKVQQ